MLFFFVIFPVATLVLGTFHFVFAALHLDHLVLAAFPALAD